jgi:uncharacterized protein YjbI with pentapeptide repeats
MAVQVSVDWPTCDQGGCIGVRLDAGRRCLAHAEDEERDAALQQFSQTGKVDARGVTIDGSLLQKILGGVPRDPDGYLVLTDARFDRAAFQCDAWFSEVIFQGDAWFSGAAFQGDAWFSGATFQCDAGFSEVTVQGDAGFSEVTVRGDAGFSEAIFEGDAWFSGATFRGDAWFSGATFRGDAWLRKATFEGTAWFSGATFRGDAWLRKATFEGTAWFSGATFQGDAGFSVATFQGTAWFGEASFQGTAFFKKATFRGGAGFDTTTFQRAEFGEAIFQSTVDFGGATFRGIAAFGGATFERAQQFGPVLAHRGLNLDGVQFVQPVQIEASTIGIYCRRARFPGGVQFRLRWARVLLDDTDLSAQSLLIGIPRLASDALALPEQRIARAWDRLSAGQISEQPRLLSLQRANVSGLGLGNVHLADCRFIGAHNLDKLRMEADVAFALSPARAGWERRQVVAEESGWRAGRARPGRWTAPWWPHWAGEKPAELTPGAIAGLYRALRKGREDAKDEPGAADFYYGEMEMRRHAHGLADGSDGGSRGRADRGVLTAYWLVSGYGLRAWRALAWLAGITTAFALAFHMVGFIRPPQPATYWTSLLYAFRSTISLTDDEVKLTAWGQLLQGLLRLTGPVLLGLALLALRGRFKR